jgi:hypothetical protein
MKQKRDELGEQGKPGDPNDPDADPNVARQQRWYGETALALATRPE